MLVGEAVEDCSAGRDLHEVEDGESEQNQNDVGEPWVESDEVKALGHVVGVKELEDIEVEKVEAVAALADEEKGAP